MKEPSSLDYEVEHENQVPAKMVLCPARATHGADLHAVCGRFHRNRRCVYICTHLEEQNLVQPTRYSEWADAHVEGMEPEGPATAGQTIHLTSKRLGHVWRILFKVEEVNPEKHQIGLHALFPLGLQRRSVVKNHTSPHFLERKIVSTHVALSATVSDLLFVCLAATGPGGCDLGPEVHYLAAEH